MRHYCDPSEDFLNACKDSFVNKICQKIPAAEAKKLSVAVPVLKYGLGTLFSLVFIGSGAAVFADKTNVEYSHPLYSLKRVVEAVRIELAPVEQLAVLHTEFAQRRLDEVKKIEAADILVATTTEAVINADIKKHQETVTKLRNQMREEVSSVISGIEEKRVQKTSVQKLCDSVSNIMKEDEKRGDGEEKEIHMKNWARLEKNCGDFINASSTNPVKEDN